MTWYETRAEVVDHQAPVVLPGQYFFLDTPACQGWVSNVRLYAPGVEFDATLVFDRGLTDPAGAVVHCYQWDDREPADVALTFVVDGDRAVTATTNSDGPGPLTVYSLGGASRPGHASSQWWMPSPPRETLHVTAHWSEVNLQGRVTVSCERWTERTTEVHRLQQP